MVSDAQHNAASFLRCSSPTSAPSCLSMSWSEEVSFEKRSIDFVSFQKGNSQSNKEEMLLETRDMNRVFHVTSTFCWFIVVGNTHTVWWHLSCSCGCVDHILFKNRTTHRVQLHSVQRWKKTGVVSVFLQLPFER